MMASIMNKFRILTLFSILLLNGPVVNAVSLPKTTGPYGVGAIDLELNDYSRIDPLSGLGSQGHRRFMISLFYPSKKTEGYPIIPYIPPATAAYLELASGVPNGTLSQIQPNSHARAPIKSCDEIQVILFSHGYQGSRFVYSGIVEDLASHGYLVVAIDHTYDSLAVEFPDGSVAYSDLTANTTDPDVISVYLDTRIKDTIFVLDALYKNLTSSIPGVRRRLGIKEVAMFGHSFGGTTTASVITEDDRVHGGLDMDGWVFGKPLSEVIDRPFVLMGTPIHNLTSDATWEALWGNLQGWKRALVLADSAHLTYCDVPVIFDLLGFPRNSTTGIGALLGTIGGLRGFEIVRTYTRAFFGFVFGGEESVLFDGPSPKYPEISFQD